MFGVFFCTFMPCHREMALSGLNARSVLRDRSAVRLALPSMAKLSMETCKHTQTKNLSFSRQSYKLVAKICFHSLLVGKSCYYTLLTLWYNQWHSAIN